MYVQLRHEIPDEREKKIIMEWNEWNIQNKQFGPASAPSER